MADRMADRIGGDDRYGTAALLAAEVVAALAAAGERPRGVLLASGEDAGSGIDALAASFLAGHLSAPLLLTSRSALPAPTAAVLRDLLPRLAGSGGGAPVVHVMGGTAVVTPAVQTAVEALGARVVRVAGDDRYATAAAAARLGAASVGSYALVAGGARRTAVLASGSNPADALSAGPLACAARVPLLLTSRDGLPEATRAALADLSIGQVVTLGGPAAISTAVLDALDALGLVVLPVRGTDRYDTSALLLSLACAPQLGAGAGEGGAAGAVGGFGVPFDRAPTGHLANGVRFPDALACGPLAGLALRPLFVTSPDGLSDATRAVLPGTAARTLVGVGRPGALPDAVLAAASAAVSATG